MVQAKVGQRQNFIMSKQIQSVTISSESIMGILPAVSVEIVVTKYQKSIQLYEH